MTKSLLKPAERALVRGINTMLVAERISSPKRVETNGGWRRAVFVSVRCKRCNESYPIELTQLKRGRPCQRCLRKKLIRGELHDAKSVAALLKVSYSRVKQLLRERGSLHAVLRMKPKGVPTWRWKGQNRSMAEICRMEIGDGSQVRVKLVLRRLRKGEPLIKALRATPRSNLVTVAGQQRPLPEMLELFEVKYATYFARVRKGMTPEEALATPVRG